VPVVDTSGTASKPCNCCGEVIVAGTASERLVAERPPLRASESLLSFLSFLSFIWLKNFLK
jgi:hypothetical protein